MKYLVTEQIESPTKLTKNIEIIDFFFVLIYFAVSLVLSEYVHDALEIPFMIFQLVSALFLTSKSVFNRQRRNYESLILLFRQDLNDYHAVYNEERISNE